MADIKLRSFTELAFQLIRDRVLGDWFGLPEGEVIVAEGRRAGLPFSEDKANEGLSGRRVIVASRSQGPAVRVYARTTVDPIMHPAHRDCEPSCKINKRGRVVLDVPCTTKAKALLLLNWSCTEPDKALVDFLEGGTR